MTETKIKTTWQEDTLKLINEAFDDWASQFQHTPNYKFNVDTSSDEVWKIDGHELHKPKLIGKSETDFDFEYIEFLEDDRTVRLNILWPFRGRPRIENITYSSDYGTLII